MKTPSKDLHQLYKRQTVLQFMIFTLITIFVWVGFSIFRSQQKTAITSEQLKLAAPLTPNIDTAVLDELEKKINYDETELENFPIYKIQIEENDQVRVPASPLPSENPQSQSSIPIDLGSIITQPTPEPTASQSGEGI